MTRAAAALLALAVVAAAGAGGAAADPMKPATPVPALTLGEERSGGEVAVVPGTLFAVDLESASGGGYTWSVTRLDAAVLELVSAETVRTPAGDPPALGAPARQRFLLRALAPGTAALELALVRPWKPAEPLRAFRLRVAVAPPAD